MNTKSIIGIVVVIAIIVGGAIWIKKAPASPEQPVVTEPVTTVDPVSTTPTTPATVSTPTTTPAPAVKGGVISTKTVNGMKIEVTKEGTGPAIANGQTAVMLYTGKLADGSVFDASSKHGNEPLSFTLGAGQVIKGWDLGILGMKVGEKRMLTIPAELGYGANGYPPVIPQNATLTFDVELVGIK